MKIPELSWPAEPQAYDEDLLLDVAAGTVVLLIRGRNAWRSTWVRHYLRNATLYTDVPSAKQAAEEQRGPGNVFYIVEAPALLLSSERCNVVLCDAHPDNPFGTFKGFDATVNPSLHGSWIDGIFPGISVRDAVATFRHTSGHWSGATPSEHSLRTGMVETSDLFDTSCRTMQSLVSRPVGSCYRLQWDPNTAGNRYTRRGANAAAKRWAEVVDGVVHHSSESSSRAEDLRRHREQVLDALPKSQWLERKQRADADRREVKQAAFQRWSQASDRASELEDAVWAAEAEQAAAQESRMSPATTAAGVRAQRERVEVATAELSRLTSALAQAEREADELWAAYSQA